MPAGSRGCTINVHMQIMSLSLCLVNKIIASMYHRGDKVYYKRAFTLFQFQSCRALPAGQEDLLDSNPTKAPVFQGDVRKNADTERWVQDAVARFGHLDIVINCAAGNFLVCFMTTRATQEWYID